MNETKISEVNTSWTEATTSPSVAMLGLISCLEHGHNAWIELRDNGDQDYPITILNPELDNPFNWTMLYGVPRNKKDMMERQYINETEKDLTYNWIACFGEEEAIKLYQEQGLITEGLIKGQGICHPVKIKDANEYRRRITGDNYEYEYWATYWMPKENIPYRVVDKSVGKVFTICFNNEPVNKADAMKKAADFLYCLAEREK